MPMPTIIRSPSSLQGARHAPHELSPPAVREISIVPINAIDAGLLTRLALCLEERFLATAVVRAPLAVPKSALNSTRGQLFFGSLVARLASAYETREDLVLGITEFD